MERTAPATVEGPDGLRGLIEEGSPDPRSGDAVLVLLEDGTRLAVPPELLSDRGDGTYRLALLRSDLDRLRDVVAGTDRGEATVIPVVAEVLDVRTREVETGRVRITKTIEQRDEVVDLPLMREEVEVQRVPVRRLADGPVAIRQEGETMILPLVEEVLVVEKRLMVREELHIRRLRTEEHRPRRVNLRTERATVERLDPDVRDAPLGPES